MGSNQPYTRKRCARGVSTCGVCAEVGLQRAGDARFPGTARDGLVGMFDPDVPSVEWLRAAFHRRPRATRDIDWAFHVFHMERCDHAVTQRLPVQRELTAVVGS
jgi:hypothetical protein